MTLLHSKSAPARAASPLSKPIIPRLSPLSLVENTAGSVITDQYGRIFRSLRVSLTAACNYACTYCVPDGKRLMKASDELSGKQLIQAARLLCMATPICKLRITGGEPLVSAKFDAFIESLERLAIEDLSITTNGQLVLQKLDVIRGSSKALRINLSLDSLQPQRFRQLARGGDLKEVLTGIDALLDLGIKLKINMVPIRGENSSEVLDLLDYCLDRGIELRYIELMRMGHLSQSSDFSEKFFGMAEILEAIGKRYSYEQIPTPNHSTALRYAIPGRGSFGIIANESHPFCAGCDRLRLAASGRLYGCLSNVRSHNLRPLLGMPKQQALPLLREMLGAALSDKQATRFTGGKIVMKMVGG